MPWLKHDGQSSLDSWLRHVVRKQGHEAGWIWWGLCEQLHTHGRGNILKRSITDVANYSCTSPRVVTRVLVQLALEYEGERKVSWSRVGNELTIEIKNFRKKQEKSGLKTPAKPPQNPSKTPLDIEEEEEGDRDNVSSGDHKRTSAKLPTPNPDKKPKERTAHQRYMDWYLTKCEGIVSPGKDIAEKKAATAGYKRFGRAASDLLAFAKGDAKRAHEGTLAIARWLEDKNLSWKLDTIVQHFPTWNQDPEGFNG